MITKCDQDKSWLLLKQPKASQNDVEFFQEKVAVFEQSYGMTEEKARNDAYFMMIEINF